MPRPAPTPPQRKHQHQPRHQTKAPIVFRAVYKTSPIIKPQNPNQSAHQLSASTPTSQSSKIHLLNRYNGSKRPKSQHTQAPRPKPTTAYPFSTLRFICQITGLNAAAQAPRRSGGRRVERRGYRPARRRLSNPFLQSFCHRIRLNTKPANQLKNMVLHQRSCNRRQNIPFCVRRFFEPIGPASNAPIRLTRRDASTIVRATLERAHLSRFWRS